MGVETVLETVEREMKADKILHLSSLRAYEQGMRDMLLVFLEDLELNQPEMCEQGSFLEKYQRMYVEMTQQHTDRVKLRLRQSGVSC